MEKSMNKFLEFNGRTIYFLSVDGTYWIAIKPICEALDVDYIQQYKNLKVDEIIGPALCVHTIQVSKNGLIQGRKMTCIPEKYVYGWLFSIRSESKELLEYKRVCYDLLYNHFHGVISGRKKLLEEKYEVQKQKSEILDILKQDEKYLQLQDILKEEKAVGQRLSGLDRSYIKTQLSIFE